MIKYLDQPVMERLRRHFTLLYGEHEARRCCERTAMLVGRYLTLLPMLAVAGSLAAKKTVADGTGTFPTATPLFMGLLVFVVLVVGGLTLLPAPALGPVVEQLQMLQP